MKSHLREQILNALPATADDLAVMFQRKERTILTYLKQLKWAGKVKLTGTLWEHA